MRLVMNTQIRELILNVVESSDSEGCSDDLTVVSSADLEALADYLLQSDKAASADSPIVVLKSNERYFGRSVPAGCTIEVHDYDEGDRIKSDTGDLGLDYDDEGDVYLRSECTG
jgi:hypothetical protein